jgi:hypothetical protein
MIYFQTKNPTLGKFSRALFDNFMVIWNILRAFGIFCFGIMYEEKSVNPAFGRLFTLNRFFFNCRSSIHILGYVYPLQKLLVYFDNKTVWATSWAIFSANSSGHRAMPPFPGFRERGADEMVSVKNSAEAIISSFAFPRLPASRTVTLRCCDLYR